MDIIATAAMKLAELENSNMYGGWQGRRPERDLLFGPLIVSLFADMHAIKNHLVQHNQLLTAYTSARMKPPC